MKILTENAFNALVKKEIEKQEKEKLQEEHLRQIERRIEELEHFAESTSQILNFFTQHNDDENSYTYSIGHNTHETEVICDEQTGEQRN